MTPELAAYIYALAINTGDIETLRPMLHPMLQFHSEWTDETFTSRARFLDDLKKRFAEVEAEGSVLGAELVSLVLRVPAVALTQGGDDNYITVVRFEARNDDITSIVLSKDSPWQTAWMTGIRPSKTDDLPDVFMPGTPSRLVQFYLSLEKDPSGRSLDQVQKLAWKQEPDSNDTFCWLFPLPMMDDEQPDAPLLTARDLVCFRKSLQLTMNAQMSLGLYLEGLGLLYTCKEGRHTIGLSPSFDVEACEWLQADSMEFRKIQRAMQFFKLIQQKEAALALKECLLSLAASSKQAFPEPLMQVLQDFRA